MTATRPAETAAAEQPLTEPVGGEVRARAPAPEETVEAPAPHAETPVAAVIAEVSTVAVQAPSSEAVVRTAPAEETQIPSMQPSPARESPTLAVDAKAYLGEAGLQLVETDPSKAASTQPEPEPVKLGRARPERPRVVEEELVQVETRGK